MWLFFIMCQALGQADLYVTSEINMIVCVSLPERSLAQEKLRERLSTCVSYFLQKGLVISPSKTGKTSWKGQVSCDRGSLGEEL